MSDDLGLNVKLALESQSYSKQIKDITQQMKVIQSEFNSASTKLNGFGNETDKLTAKAQSLGKQFELQKQIVSKYSEQFDKAKQNLEKNTKANAELTDKVKLTTSAYNASVTSTGKNSEASKKLKTEVDELNKKFILSQNAINSNTKSINGYSIKMNTAQTSANKLESQLKEMNTQITTQSSKWTAVGTAMTSAGDKMKKIGKTSTDVGKKLSVGLTAPIVGVGIAAAKVGMDFEASMSKVQAISGATGNTFKQLNDQALQLGQDTAFSAKEAADGMENLASAGFDTTEIMQAMPGMLNLAASGGLAVADASDIASSALRGFGLAATQSGHVADVLADVSAKTNANVTDMGLALKYAAAPAHAMGLSIEEVSAAVGEMANVGIKGEQAGTTLRSSLVNLASPTKQAAKIMKDLGINAFDSHGKMLPFKDVIDNLAKSTANLSQEDKANALSTIFGKESLSGMLTLVSDGPTKLDTLTQSFKKSDGAAAAMAKTMQNNAKSSIEQMMGSLETAGIKMEQAFAPAITKVALEVQDLANAFSNLSPKTQDVILKLALGVAVIGPTLVGVGKLAAAVGVISKAFGAASIAMGIGAEATAGVGAAGVAGATGLGAAGLAGALGTAAVAALPFVVAGAAVVGTGLLIKSNMDEKVTPAVDLFADSYTTAATKVGGANAQIGAGYDTTVTKISAGTKKVIGSYMELDAKASASLQNLCLNSTIITAKNSATIMSQYQGLTAQVKAKLDARYNTEYATMKAFFDKSNTLSTADEAKALAKLKADNENKKKTESNYATQILAIIKGASDKKRALTLDEQIKINGIQGKMRTNAVKTLSASEVESKVIMQRLKDYGSNITAEQASTEIKNANKARDGQVKSANDIYNKSLAAIIQMRDGSHSITADQATKLIADAKRQKDGTVKHAEELRSGAVGKIQSMNKSIGDSVNTTTGNMITKWDSFKTYWKNLIFGKKTLTVDSKVTTPTPKDTTVLTSGRGLKGSQFAKGTDNAPGGPSLVGELGPEILNLKKGDTVTTAANTAKLLSPKVLDQTKQYAKIGTQITTGLTAGIKKGSPLLLTGMATMTKGIMNNFNKGIVDSNKPSVKATTDLSNGVSTVFKTLSKASNPLGAGVITQLSTGMKNTTSLLNTTTNNLSTGTKNIVNSLVKASNPLGSNVVTQLSTGMKNTTGTLNNATTSLSTGTKSAFSKLAKDVNPIGNNVTQGLSDGMKSSQSNLVAVTKTLTDKVIEAFKIGFDIHSPSRETFSIGENVGQGWINGVKSKDLKGFADKQIGSMLGSFSSSGVAGNSQLNSWLMQAMAITGTPMQYMPALRQVVMGESGGDPKAINLWDSNFLAGHPSKGIAQMIDSTFQAHKMPGMNDIWNPVDNLVSSIRYQVSQYGSIANTPGVKSLRNGSGYVGYAAGTLNASPGLKWVGEHGPELLNFRGGETITDAKKSAKIAANNKNNNNGLTINIEKFINNTKQDMETLMTEAAFYFKQKQMGGSRQ